MDELAKIIDVHLIMNEVENKVNAYDIAKDIINNGYRKIAYGKWTISNFTENSSFAECPNCHILLYGSAKLGANFCPDCGTDLREKMEEDKC